MWLVVQYEDNDDPSQDSQDVEACTEKYWYYLSFETLDLLIPHELPPAMTWEVAVDSMSSHLTFLHHHHPGRVIK